MRVLIAGLSTRAAAESAATAGFEVTAIDGFGDRDQHPAVRSLAMPRDFPPSPGPRRASAKRLTAAALARASRSIDCDAVAYLSPFENHPHAVATLARDRTLLGNPPEVLRAVRDPVRLAGAFRERGLAAPDVRVNLSNLSNFSNPSNQWLLKPLASGGGRRIRRWNGERIPPRSYLQEFVDGIPGSVVFMSAAGRSTPIAITRQLIGDAAFGASGFQYCGSILASAGAVGAERLAAAVTDAFGLVGLNVIDFIARDGVPYPIEVNPRWSGSMELVDRVAAVPLFALQAALCASGEPPPVFLAWARPPRGGVIGRAIVFARRDVAIGDTAAWLDDPTVRDVPHPGERIAAGRPVCSVFADGADYEACHAALAARAADVYRQLTAWR